MNIVRCYYNATKVPSRLNNYVDECTSSSRSALSSFSQKDTPHLPENVSDDCGNLCQGRKENLIFRYIIFHPLQILYRIQGHSRALPCSLHAANSPSSEPVLLESGISLALLCRCWVGQLVDFGSYYEMPLRQHTQGRARDVEY